MANVQSDNSSLGITPPQTLGSLSSGSNPGVVANPANQPTNPKAFRVAQQLSSNLQFIGRDAGKINIGTVEVGPNELETGIQILDPDGNIIAELTDGSVDGIYIFYQSPANRNSNSPFIEISDSSASKDEALSIFAGNQTIGESITMDGTALQTADSYGLLVTNNQYATNNLVAIDNVSTDNFEAPLIIANAAKTNDGSTYDATGHFIMTEIIGGVTIWTSDGTTPNGSLSGSEGDICLNGTGGQTFYCTGITAWSAMGGGLMTSSVYWYLNASVVPAGQTYYAGAGNFGSGENLITQTPIPSSGTISKFYVGTATAQPATGGLILILRKNAANTALQIVLPGGSPASSYYNLTDTATVVSGDLLDLQITNSAATNSAIPVYLAFQLSP